MIYVDEKKRLNDFVEVYCCRPRDLYSRFGKRVPLNPDFESSEENIPMNMSKIESIEYIQNYDRMMQERENVSEVQENNHSNDNSPADET